jgi:hypothetical protein
MLDPEMKDTLKGCAPWFFLWLFVVLPFGFLTYVVVVIIFRRAFGIELPNPFP